MVSYLILADEFMQWGKDADGNYTRPVYLPRPEQGHDGALSQQTTRSWEDLTLTFCRQ